ncbi:heme ABC transporter ATP-binding protein [Neogemmobacter tilapiae]|uniref:Hemin import ATP-binding protein HmuV n=1 Tax=Neogemmobacter tilapiae TaxID=875041 RepID=A0A918TUG3_9RHOB|nr:heme ABC transporter ATP-binding protein [Gemmobacter tilapiae]GHC63373.1 hemin import ATP-binding protein HmuV [Gemmobacter tilapiae]
MIRAEKLTLGHGSRTLIRALDFEAKPGAITVIAGPNGAGKTTLLRALTGESRPLAGQVTLNGRNLAAQKPGHLALQRAVLPQSPQMAFAFRADQVVSMGQEAGLAAGRRGIVPAALARVGLSDFGPRVLTTMSGGEQLRVHLARALAQVWEPVGPNGPCWLLLDEPVASLDIGHQLQVMNLARAFADAGGGVIAVLHDLNLTAMYAGHVCLLGKSGRIAEGRPDQVLTDSHLQSAYDCAIRVNTLPTNGPFLLPQVAGAAA